MPDCDRCEGCGQIDSGDEGAPWTFWASLPPGSDLAVRMGLVWPRQCPACGGSGDAEMPVTPTDESHRSAAPKSDDQDENAKMAATWEIWSEVRNERIRAHQKHQATSMEAMASDDPARYFILMEEGAGEVAKEFNDARHEDRPVDKRKLCAELIQTSAMSGAWADKLLREIEAGDV